MLLAKLVFPEGTGSNFLVLKTLVDRDAVFTVVRYYRLKLSSRGQVLRYSEGQCVVQEKEIPAQNLE